MKSKFLTVSDKICPSFPISLHTIHVLGTQNVLLLLECAISLLPQGLCTHHLFCLWSYSPDFHSAHSLTLFRIFILFYLFLFGQMSLVREVSGPPYPKTVSVHVYRFPWLYFLLRAYYSLTLHFAFIHLSLEAAH